MYSSLPKSVEVRLSNANGRGIWAKGPIKAGMASFALPPYASALSTRNLTTHCSSCFASSSPDGMRRCTKCRSAYYCDSTCQTNDWGIHKYECTSLQKWFQAAPSSDVPPPSDAVRCLGRILWRIQKNGVDSVQSKELANMHRQLMKRTLHLAHSLVQYLGFTSPADMAEFGFLSAADLVDLISRFVTNTFTITDPALTPLGAAVSPVVALINHSCDPNAVVVFPRTAEDLKRQEPLMQVVAIRDIFPDEEVILYTHLNLRQQTLEETYNFTCACRLCTSINDVDPREAMNCPKNCGGLCPLPSDDASVIRCVKCKSVVKSVEAILDAARVGQEGLDKASSLQDSNPAKSIQLTTNLIPILASAGLPPSSHPLLGLSRLHQTLLTSSFPDPLTQDHLDETIRTVTKNVAGLSSILREGHPVLAIAITELGKLLAVDEPSPEEAHNVEKAGSSRMGAGLSAYPPSGLPRLKLAYDYLLRARKMLLVAFGVVNEGGQVGREVREMVVALEKEIGVFKQGVRNVLEDTPQQKS
ncbi:SET domain-containing protein [Rhodocollybia butyracea]|uniref:SET domain-containing protein n=1 Tax=Rhodocollybia butyracea TaxID=206335 RepID=A0A9P5PAK9_9AGAR|nr:SET domain-containing protein [Rhodocollybia butyracea]